MLKWILGGCLGLIVIACVVLWLGYRKLQTVAAAGPSTSVTVAAPAARVFASIADADSLSDWRAEGARITASHRGLLSVGDTLTMESSRQGARFVWVVSAVSPGVVVAFDAIDSASHRTVFTRRDSLVAAGDSTRIVSTFATSFLDSIQTKSGKTSPMGQRMMDLASTAMVAGFRMQSEVELARLKGRIEGHAPMPVKRP